MGADTFYLADFFAVDSNIILSVILRSALMTIFVLVAIRWMGKKGLGQLKMYELIILIGLKTAIGDPMLYHLASGKTHTLQRWDGREPLIRNFLYQYNVTARQGDADSKLECEA